MNEPELESARQRFTGPAQVLFQQARAGLLLIDPLTERVLDANAMAQRLTEFSRPEMLEMALRSLVRHEQPWHDPRRGRPTSGDLSSRSARRHRSVGPPPAVSR